MRILYKLLSYLVIGLTLPYWFLHKKVKHGIRRRFGGYPYQPWPSAQKPGPRIWFHGASAGDLLALRPVVQSVRELLPDATLIISSMTNSGAAIAEKRFSSLCEGQTYVPYDLPGATRRAVAAIQPDILVLEYTELWPNLISAARATGCRLVLSNGRIGENRMQAYRWLQRIAGNILEQFDLLLMRDEHEAERVTQLGGMRKAVKVTGNTKFDNLVHDQLPAPHPDIVNAVGERPLWVAGSTHEGEEKTIVHCFLQIRKKHPTLRLLLAPRYVERAPRIFQMAEGEGLKVCLRSQLMGHQGELDCIVLDTVGELAGVYGLGTLVFVGGSFTDRGGQNILEPAAFGKPVLFGPNMRNFRDSVEVLLGRGGLQVPSPERLTELVIELLDRPEEIQRLGGMAKSAVSKVSGASVRNARLIAKLARE